MKTTNKENLISDLNTVYSAMGKTMFINTVNMIRDIDNLKLQLRFGRNYLSMMGFNWYHQKAFLLFACRHKDHWLSSAHIN